MRSKSSLILLAGAVVTGVGMPALGVVMFTPGDLVVEQVGSGAAYASAQAAPVLLDEYSPSGHLVQQVTLTNATTGTAPTTGQRDLTDSISATSEGTIELSGDQHFLTVVGYNAIDGTASVASTTSAATSRVIGLVKYDGTQDTSTAFNNVASGNNIRSAVTDDGHEFWIGAAASTGVAASGGLQYVVGGVGSSSATQLSTVDSRSVEIYKGQLYDSSQIKSPSNAGVNSAGTGTPTAASSLTLLTAAASGSPSTGSYFFANPTTVYVADDRSISGGNGGLQKWTYSSSASKWILVYTLAGGLSTNGVLGISGTVTNGVATLYVTTDSQSDGFTHLESISDTLSATSSTATFSSLATASTNTAFRTVVQAPSPVSLLAANPTSSTLGAVTVNGNETAGYNVVNLATGGATSGVVDIKGNLATSTDPVLIYLDLDSDSQAAGLATALSGQPGLTATVGTFNPGDGVTYDVSLLYSGNPSIGTDEYFDYDFSDVSINGTPTSVAVDNIAVVPEPVSGAMILLGVTIPLLGRRRRKV